MNALPYELYTSIIEHYLAPGVTFLPESGAERARRRQRQLYPLLYVSHAIHLEARRLLYHSCSINLREDRGFKLLRILAASPHLGEQVTSLDLNTSTMSEIPLEGDMQPMEVADRVLNSLRNMTRLTALSLSHFRGPSPTFLRSLADDCPFRLTSLALILMEEYPFLWQWVQTQNGITSFSLSTPLSPVIPPDIHILPNLQNMHAPGAVAVAIINTGARPHLKHLHISMLRFPNVLPWNNTSSIQTLTMASVSQSPSEMLGPKTLSPFRDLVKLSLYFTSGKEWDNLHNINLRYLRNLPRLRMVLLDIPFRMDTIQRFALRIMETVEWLEECHYWSSRSKGQYVRINGIPQQVRRA